MSAPSAPKMITNVASRRIRSQSLSLPDVEGFDDDGGGCTPAPFDLDLPPDTLSSAACEADDSMLVELCCPNSASTSSSTLSSLVHPPPVPSFDGIAEVSEISTPPPSPRRNDGRFERIPKSPPQTQSSVRSFQSSSTTASEFGTSAKAGGGKVLSFQNLSMLGNRGAINARVSPSYSMFQTVKDTKVEGDYDSIGETGQLYLGSLESGFTQNFESESTSPPSLSYRAVLHHNCSQLLICTHSINEKTLETMQTQLSGSNCKVSFVSSAEDDCVQHCAKLILPSPLRTFVVCDDGDRVGPAIIATYMQWKDSGTYNDWISWVQGYRPSIVKDWWKGRKRKGSSEIIDGTDSDGGPPSVVGTDPSETESPKRTKPNEPGDIDDELFDIGSSVKCNFTTHRDPGHLSSDSPTPLLTPPPPASHGLEWPSGLTFDCGLLNTEEMREKMDNGSGNQTTGLTPMIQGKSGGNIEGGFSLS